MTMSSTIMSDVKYKVKDISLADWEEKEIRLAEAEMPGLMSIRRVCSSTTFKGVVLQDAFMTIQTAVLIGT